MVKHLERLSAGADRLTDSFETPIRRMGMSIRNGGMPHQRKGTSKSATIVQA